MAGRSLRDRIYTRPVARSMTSPAAILATGGGLAAGITLGLALPAIVALGVGGWSIPVALAVQRTGRRPGQRAERIDPFALAEPWRLHVVAALKSQVSAHELVKGTSPGPLRDSLQEIAGRVDLAVDESWQIAKRGDLLAGKRNAVDRRAIDRDIRDLEQRLEAEPDERRLVEALEAQQAQRAAAERMDDVIRDTDTQLTVMDAKIGEIVVRATELSAHSGGAPLGGLSGDVDSLVGEMEALRLALEEAHGL